MKEEELKDGEERFDPTVLDEAIDGLDDPLALIDDDIPLVPIIEEETTPEHNDEEDDFNFFTTEEDEQDGMY